MILLDPRQVGQCLTFWRNDPKVAFLSITLKSAQEAAFRVEAHLFKIVEVVCVKWNFCTAWTLECGDVASDDERDCRRGSSLTA